MTKLVCDKDKILDCKPFIKKVGEEEIEMVRYAYIDDEVTHEKDEVKRTHNSYHVRISPTQIKARCFVRNKFYQDAEGKWFNVSLAELTKEEWQAEDVL